MIQFKFSVFSITADAKQKDLLSVNSQVGDVADIDLQALMKSARVLYPKSAGIQLTVMP